MATTMLMVMKTTVQIRAMSSPVAGGRFLAPRTSAGMMSRVTTAETALASDDAMAIVWENIPARVSPTRPAGRYDSAISA